MDNSLGAESINNYIPQLEAREVAVLQKPTPPSPILASVTSALPYPSLYLGYRITLLRPEKEQT
jgi:hypothetical protein